MTLYLKYRPQVFGDLDCTVARESLIKIFSSDNIPHAFLLSGPKGIGKTSAARIIAKALNCKKGKKGEPCNKCVSCLSIMKGNNIDVIELDAASNRGIDDIRSLKEGVYLAPAAARTKVYIIDEAHMLTLEAANAFLKTLEEPPSHVVFILATTNPEKLPQTVLSRLTQINFTKATNEEISSQLMRVAKGEKIKIEKKAVDLIVRYSDGSFRDAVKILENVLLKTKGSVKESDVQVVLQSYLSNITSFFELLETGSVNSALGFIEDFVKKGGSIRRFSDEMIDFLHKSLLAKSGIGEDILIGFSQPELISLIDLVSDTKNQNSPLAQLPLEIAILKYCRKFKVVLDEKKEEEKVEKKVQAQTLDE